MQSSFSSTFKAIIPAVCLMTLVACGGGGSSGSSAPTNPVTPAAPITITGVAATGTPMVKASIKIVDATGAAVSLVDANGNVISNGLTSAVDGSYSVTLKTTTPTMPLLIEAVGLDARGLPVVLHSMLQTNVAPFVANITPLTNAVLAEMLGANPLSVFQSASSNASSIAALSSTTMLATASTEIKTVIAKNLADAKVSSASTLNLFQDATFTANKTLLDAALDALRVRIVTDSSGNDQLQISNKFVAIAQPEVEISLPVAKAQLVLGSTGKISSAIVSTLATTTSSTTSVANFSTLDSLTIAINNLVAQRATATSFAALASAVPTPPSPAPASATGNTYTYNGRTLAQLEQLLAGYATNNYQLSSLEVTGCIDDPLPSKGCTNFAVSAVVTDVNGNIVDYFHDGITYSKTTTPNWTISGNGRYADIGIYPVAYATFGLNGVLNTSASNNPAVGLQASISDVDSTGTETVGNSSIQLPSDQIYPMAYCGMNLLCLWPAPAVLPVATGNLADTLLQQPASGWSGSINAVLGAKFIVTYASWITVTNQTANAYLPATLPTNLSTSLFPAIDGISTSAPLTGATITAGFTMSWKTWAAANPNMKIFMVRTVIDGAGVSPLITDNTLPFGNVTSIGVTPTVLPSGFVASSYEVWIGAENSLGQRYFTQLVGSL